MNLNTQNNNGWKDHVYLQIKFIYTRMFLAIYNL